MSFQNEPVKAAGFILFRRAPPEKEVEYLLLQAMSGRRYWSPPKGHNEPDESIYETALRKTREETGFEPKSYRVIPEFNCDVNYNVSKKGIKRPKVVTFWCAERFWVR